MWVTLKANWFVGGSLIYRGNPPGRAVEVPDSLRHKLPKGAVIVQEGPEAPVAEAPKTLAELQRERTAGRSLVDYLNRNAKPEPVPEPAPEPAPVVKYGPDPNLWPVQKTPEPDPIAAAKAAAEKAKPQGKKSNGRKKKE